MANVNLENLAGQGEELTIVTKQGVINFHPLEYLAGLTLRDAHKGLNYENQIN